MCSLREKSPSNWSQSRSALKEPLPHPPVDLSSGILSTFHISRQEIQMLQTLNLLWPLGPVSDELPASYVHMQYAYVLISRELNFQLSESKKGILLALTWV